MLKSLFIRNYVLIDDLDIRFDKDLSVVTGETGAGKSVILGALSLALGQRADGKSIRQGADKCVIEAVFDISAYQLDTFFQEHDLEYDAESCIVRRELFTSGKSRSFINDSPSSLMILKELGSRLIDIHSQHQNLLLGDSRFQLKIVDIMARNEKLLASYKESYNELQLLKRGLKDLEEKAAQSKQEEDYMRFQLQQLEEASLEKEEQDSLEQEQKVLSHSEEIKGNLYRITGLLNGDTPGALSLLKESLLVADSLERYFPKAKEIAERIRTAYIDMNDLASEAEVLQEDIEFNPQRLEWITDRLNTIYSLQQKHRVSTVEDLIAIQEEYGTELREIESFDEQIQELQKQIELVSVKLFKQAAQLTKQRKNISGEVTKQLTRMVTPLGIPNARFQIDFEERKEPAGDGVDDVRFLFSANKNGEMQPVAQTASGGEISRLMLCIKAMIAGFTALPTIIFDEVDTGVSGDIASRMGDIMRSLGDKMQVIAITHLPQVAAKGNVHYFVYKEDTKERTITRIRQLTPGERVREVARMLSGTSLTDASIANAKDLLQVKH